MTRVAFPVTDVDRLAGAAERRDAVDSDGAAGARDRLAPTRIGLTLPTATRAGGPERCELMDEYAAVTKLTRLGYVSYQSRCSVPQSQGFATVTSEGPWTNADLYGVPTR